MAGKDLELIDWPEAVPLLVSVRRAALRFPVKAKAADDRPMVQNVRVTGVKAQRAGAGRKNAGLDAYVASDAPLILRGVGDAAIGNVSLQLDRTMPPGEYLASLEIAGVRRDVSFAIMEDIALRIRPALAIIDASGVRSGDVAVSFENRGNVPLMIDLRGDYPLGREEPLVANAPDTDSALAGLTAALNRAPRVLTEIGTIGIAMPEGAFTLEPGTARVAPVRASWSFELDPARRYRALVPVFGSELEIAVVTASKPGKEQPAARAGGKT